MGTELLRMYASSLMVVCYRSVARHPFLVGMIIFLFSMYRLFPLLFSLVVSASPVVVSTAVLLGTLLSYGQPNIPEIEKETEKESDRDEIRKSESKVTGSSEGVVGRDESFVVSEESNASRIEVADRSFDGNTFVESDNRLVNLVDDGEFRFGEERLVEEGKNEMDDEKVVLGSRYSPLQQSESDDKLWEGSPDPLNTNAGLLWKRMEGDHDEDGVDDDDEDDDENEDEDEDEDEDDEDDDSGGSDLAESSSPDASMADIIPMLDELHPLLSEEREAREGPHMSRDGIDAVLEHSLESSDTGSESNYDDDNGGGGIEKREDLDAGDDEDGKDKESKHVEQEYETRSAILWTEYDQKNLMNLGTSEMERNRRLENLIARRRARKTMRMQAEKNLIDLESADLPWNIPPISTARINPFDYDTNDNIPGSAPSVLLKRRNPFDLPYDSSEEKPDLVGDTFQQEFAAIIQPKEPFFRRHESFNVGPSIFGASRSERQETKLRPYFVPEQSFTEFQRQFSGLSDSKVSSVPDTESVSSAGDFESKDHVEEDEHSLEAEMVSGKDHENVSDDVSHRRPYFVPEHLASDQTSFSSFQRQLSEVSESKVSSVRDTESVSSASDDENKDHNGDEHSFEVEQASEIRDHVSENASQDSESVEDDAEVDSVQVLEEDVGVDNENENVGSATNQQEISSDSENEAGIQLNSGDVELHSRRLSLSSSDEVSDQVYNEKEDDDVLEVATLVPETTYFVDRSNSIERSDTDVTSLLVEESHPNEPIYDLSPRSVTRNLSSNSILNDLHKDESFQHSEDQHESSSSVADVKWNSTDSGPETTDAQSQLPTVLHNEVTLSGSDNISTPLPNKSLLEMEGYVQLDMDASIHQLEQVQVPSSSSHEDFHQEEDPEELVQGGQLEEGQVASSNSEVVHEETYETLHQFVSEGEAQSQPQKEVLLDTSLNKSEENPQVLQVQSTSNNLDNLQIQEPDNILLHNMNSASSTESDVVEVIDTETQALGSPEYASDSHNSIESNNVRDDIDDDEIDEDLLVELDAVGDFSIKSSGSTFNEMKDEPPQLEHDHETKATADEESYSKDLESVLDEIKQEPHASEHDLETTHSVDLDSTYSKDLGSTLSEITLDLQASDHDLETKDFVGEDSYPKDLGLALNKMKQDPHGFDRDVGTTNYEEESSYSKDLGSTLDETKQDLHASDEHDLETKCSGDEDSDSKDIGSTSKEMKQDTLASDHDLETNRFVDEDSDSKDLGSTLNEMQQDPHVSDQDLETNRFVDEDSDSKDLGSTLNEIEQDPRPSKHDHLETNSSVDDDFYSKDLESTFNEMRQDPHASDHHCLETFYSVDDNFFSKHVDSTLNEMKQDLQALEHDLETTRSDDEMDTQVMKSQNEKGVSNIEDAGPLETEASKIKLINDANEVILPQETESSTSLADSTSATMGDHETETASSTRNTDKE